MPNELLLFRENTVDVNSNAPISRIKKIWIPTTEESYVKTIRIFPTKYTHFLVTTTVAILQWQEQLLN